MPAKTKKKPVKKPALKPKKAAKTVKAVKAAKTTKPKKAGASKSVVARIKQVVAPKGATVVPANQNEPVLVTPLPQREVKNFGAMPFEAQAKLILETFPADAAEIVGTTQNSGAGTVSAPPVAGA